MKWFNMQREENTHCENVNRHILTNGFYDQNVIKFQFKPLAITKQLYHQREECHQ